MTTRLPRTASVLACVALAIGLASLSIAPGCAIAALGGVVGKSLQETGSHKVQAEYDGLDGKSYAVVVSGDRSIASEHPGVMDRLTDRINTMIAEGTTASGHVPTTTILAALYNNPQWQAISRGDLGQRLGVERLVVVELNEYRLHESGNQYTWEGAASAVVEVYEIDGGDPDLPLFEHSIRVTYPDELGILREQLPESLVTSVLSDRMADRVAWLFFDHEERNAIEY